MVDYWSKIQKFTSQGIPETVEMLLKKAGYNSKLSLEQLNLDCIKDIEE